MTAKRGESGAGFLGFLSAIATAVLFMLAGALAQAGQGVVLPAWPLAAALGVISLGIFMYSWRSA